MRKEDKSTVIEQIASTLKEYSHFYLAETAALNAEKTSALRRECFKQDIKLLVVKNALLHKAMESLDTDYTPLYDCLKGSTAVMFTNTGNAPAKLIKEFRKSTSDLLNFKAAYVEESFYIGCLLYTSVPTPSRVLCFCPSCSTTPAPVFRPMSA